MPFYLGELTEKIVQDDRIPILKASQDKLKVGLISILSLGILLPIVVLDTICKIFYILLIPIFYLLIIRNSFHSVKPWSLSLKRS